MKKPKIFSIGGATYDIYVKTSDQAIMTLGTTKTRDAYLCLKHGGKVLVDEVIETFGGGATNTSVAFSRMGFEAYFVGVIGDTYGDRVLENLKKEKVSTKYSRTTNKEKTAFSVIINTFDGDRTVLAYPGANKYLCAKDFPFEAMKNADLIYLNHLSEQDNLMHDKLEKFLYQNPNVQLAWNPGKEQLVQGLKKWKKLLKRTQILFLNKEEAALLTGIQYKLAGIKKEDPKHHVHYAKNFLPPYADDVSEIMIKLLECGVKTVVITDGRNGAQVTDGKEIYFCPVVTTKRVDTLGAGDSFASGFVSARLLRKDLKMALVYGTLNANSVVGTYGAQPGLLHRNEMEKRSGKHQLEITHTRLLK